MLQQEQVFDIFERFRQVATHRGSEVALIVDGEEYNYAQLLRMIESCAERLRAAGCVEGNACMLLFPNGLDFVVSSFAVFAVNAVLVPLNTRFTEEEILHYMDVCSPKVVFCDTSLSERLNFQSGDGITVLTTAADVHPDSQECRSVQQRLDEGLSPNRPGLYMFSSGSTGKSKRVTRTQEQILTEYYSLARTIGLTDSDRILCTVPLYHAHGFGNAMMAALLSGGCLVLLTNEFSPRATMRAIQGYGITIFPAVPFMFKMISEIHFSRMPDIESVRLLFSAGAPLPVETSEEFGRRFGKSVGQLYGSTETGAISINTGQALGKPNSVGLPLDGISIRIQDETGKQLEPSEQGEIWIRSPAMTHQYDELDDLSRECFVDDYFFAGDLGYKDEQEYLYVTGRKKLMINVAGYKVDPIEVEDVIREHPSITDVVVLGIADPAYGEMIKAVVVMREVKTCKEDDIKSYCKGSLAEYKIPKVIEFRKEIPRNPLGKILRKYL